MTGMLEGKNAVGRPHLMHTQKIIEEQPQSEEDGGKMRRLENDWYSTKRERERESMQL